MTNYIDALVAKGPHPSLGAHAETYGRVIGSWTGELDNHRLPDVPRSTVEIHFAWVLDGRAVQDVWITPPRHARWPNDKPATDWFGTTLRVFDPPRECWRVSWTDPVGGWQIALEGRRQGDDIVQLGIRDGRLIRWTFTNIEPDAFRWQGHVLELDGVTWQLEVDIHARRTSR